MENGILKNDALQFKTSGKRRKLKKFVVSGPLACLYYLSRECPDLREIKIGVWSNISDNLIHAISCSLVLARLGFTCSLLDGVLDCQVQLRPNPTLATAMLIMMGLFLV